MEKTQEEKKAAFMDRAAKNKANFELHKKLISEKLEHWHGLQKASIDHFAQTGKASGSFFLALMDYAESYYKERCKNEIESTALQLQQADVSGSLRLEKIAKELWDDGRMIKAIQIIEVTKGITMKDAKQYCDEVWGRNDR